MARTPRHSMARSQLVERVMATDSFKATQYFFTDFAYRHQRVSCTRLGGEDRTPRRTHVLCVAHLITDHHTRLRVAQVWDVLHFCASQKSSTHNMFHRPLFDVPDPFPSLCSTSPPSTPTALPMTGIRRPTCATPPGGSLFGPSFGEGE